MTCTFCDRQAITNIGKARYCNHCLSSKEHNETCRGCSRSDCYKNQERHRKALLRQKRPSKKDTAALRDVERERFSTVKGEFKEFLPVWAQKKNPSKRRKRGKRKNPCAGCARLAKYGKECKRHAPSDFVPKVPKINKDYWDEGGESWDLNRTIGQYTKMEKKKNPCAGCDRLAKYGKECKRHAPSDFVPARAASLGDLFYTGNKSSKGQGYNICACGKYTKSWRSLECPSCKSKKASAVAKKRRAAEENAIVKFRAKKAKIAKRSRRSNPPAANALIKLGMVIGVLYAIKKFLGK